MPDCNSRAFSLGLRVYYEDTDASGVVYHANYFRYCERARTEWLEARGVNHRLLAQSDGLVFTLADTSMRFIYPARLDDRLDVTARVVEQGRVRLVFGQEIWCADRLLIKAEFTVACVNIRDFKPRRIPSGLLPAGLSKEIE
ncbi:MAG: tol-pal system-associated acyl-CoA thioesterase [Salinisphaera sp.]|jgi:acyl-CoA thioester hydrolase|nr:tol-pal system-associated acyl-CoA thioesterase [Salinisphaera sp.]